MKNKKLLASLLAGAMVLSLAACGEEPSGSSSVEESTSEVQQSAEAEPTAEPAPEAAPASIDFEDGNMGFVAPRHHSQRRRKVRKHTAYFQLAGAQSMYIPK